IRPTIGFAPLCAKTYQGIAASVPPANPMKSRRLMKPPKARPENVSLKPEHLKRPSWLRHQRIAPQKVMSALHSKADRCSANTDVGYGPIADMHIAIAAR